MLDSLLKNYSNYLSSLGARGESQYHKYNHDVAKNEAMDVDLNSFDCPVDLLNVNISHLPGLKKIDSFMFSLSIVMPYKHDIN